MSQCLDPGPTHCRCTRFIFDSQFTSHNRFFSTLKFFGASDKRNELEPKLIWATPGQRGFNLPSSSRGTTGRTANVASTSTQMPTASQTKANPAQAAARIEAIRKQQEATQKAAELKQMLSTLEKVDDDGRRGSLLDSLCSKDDILSLPVHEDPPSIASGDLKVNLLRHQVCCSVFGLSPFNFRLHLATSFKMVHRSREPKTSAKRNRRTSAVLAIAQARQSGQVLWKLLNCIANIFPVLLLQQFVLWTIGLSLTKSFLVATKTPQEAPPTLGRGALCADAMVCFFSIYV